MPDLTITVDGARVVPFAAVPLLSFQLSVTNAPNHEVIHAVMLRCQLQLEVTRRQYTTAEETELRDLFGTTDRWSNTLRSMLWTHATVMVPRFAERVTVELPVPCTFDFNVAATKYFHGLTQGDVPLMFLFSGTIFYEDEDDALKVHPVSWEKEARFRLPASTWRELMQSYYPNVAWVTLRRDVFQRLQDYKVERGIPTWEQALESLLASADDVVGT